MNFKPTMPKGSAKWLIDNTFLTFQQIANYVGMHVFEIQSMADEIIFSNIRPFNPLPSGELTKEEISRCEADSKTSLQGKDALAKINQKHSNKKYTPVSKRQDKPNGILWLLKNYPEMTPNQIGNLIGTTKNTIQAIKSRNHWNMQNIEAKDPVLLGLCDQTNLMLAINKLQKDGKKTKDVES